MNDTTPKLLLKPKEAAAALSIGQRKLWELTNCGEIPSIRIGRQLRYDVDALREWIAQQSAQR